MDIRYYIVAPGMLLLSAYAWTLLPRLWRHENTALDHRPAWWPGGLVSWRGFVRTLPLAVLFCWLLTLFIVLGPFIPEQPRDAFGFIRPAWYSLPLAIAPLVAIPLWISIYLFNRPRFLVPPHLREERTGGSEP
jgi:hypothetical protein